MYHTKAVEMSDRWCGRSDQTSYDMTASILRSACCFLSNRNESRKYGDHDASLLYRTPPDR